MAKKRAVNKNDVKNRNNLTTPQDVIRIPVEYFTTPTVDDIIEFEMGEMSEEDEVVFVNKLYYSGLYMHLQGSYQRLVAVAIEAGLIVGL